MSSEELLTYGDMLYLVDTIIELKHFFNSNEKSAAWMVTQNPHLGEAKPIDLFLKGRGFKVIQFVRSARQGEGP